MNECPLCRRKPNEIIRAANALSDEMISCLICGKYIYSHTLTNAYEEDVLVKISHLMAERHLYKNSFVLLTLRKDDYPPIVYASDLDQQGDGWQSLKTIREEYRKRMNGEKQYNSNEIFYETIVIDELLSTYPVGWDIFDRILKNIAAKLPHPFSSFKSDGIDNDFMFSANDLQKQTALSLLVSMEYLSIIANGPIYSIAPAGWRRIKEMAYDKKFNKQVFVAMWFSPGMDSVYTNGIKPAVEEAGYKCVRIDKTEHSDKICDKIIAEIRRSDFIIADFTGNRGGVYYEAGFAHGLNMPVIWLGKSSYFWNSDGTKNEEIHFDIRQYNFIFYKTIPELKERLSNRINAII